MSNYEAVFPPEEKKGKRGRGRPTVEVADVRAALYNFPGPSKEEKLIQLYEDWFGCTRCFLGEFRCTQSREGDGDIVFFTGNPDAHILIVGEAPGEQEMEEKSAFIGPAGQVLNLVLAATTDDPEIQELYKSYAKGTRTVAAQNAFHEKVHEWRNNEFAIANVVSCRPPDNRAPTLPEMKACWERLWNIIYIVDPMLIIACGNTAMASVTRKLSAQITKSRGQIFDVSLDGKIGKVTYPVMPVFHPSYLSRVSDWSQQGGVCQKTIEDWKRGLRLVDFLRLQHFNTPMPKR